jgi:cation-transporting ATPase I
MVLWRALELTARAAGTVVGASLGAASGVGELLGAATSGATSHAPGRTHVAVRGVHTIGAEPQTARIEELLGRHDAVTRAEVNAVLGRVMVEHDPDVLAVADVVRLVRAAERECGLHDARPAPAGATHPAEPGPVLREIALFGLHLTGLTWTAVGAALPAPPPVSLPAAVIALADTAPRIRAFAATALGEPTADALLNAAAGVTNLVGRRPLGLICDACQRYVLHQEAAARRRAWEGWDRRLSERDGGHRAAPHAAGPRPAPLPPGPVERVADRTAAVALTAAGALLATSRASHVSAALTAGAAKAARAGREGFAAQLDRDVCERGSLVLDPAVLRRLDRVDTVVLDAAVLLTGRQVVEEVLPLTAEVGPDELVERAHDVTDLRRSRRRERDGWSASPVAGLAAVRAGLPAGARALADRAARLLVLERAGRAVALVGVADELDPFAEAIVAAASRAGLVLVAGPPWLQRRLDADGTVAGGPALTSSVRALQEAGHGVVLVSGSDRTALAAADAGIGLAGAARAVPWGADVLVRGAAEACLLLDATVAARRVSRRCSRLALGGSGLGALFAALGPATGAAGRAAIPVQTAALFALGLGTWSGMALARHPDPAPAERTPWHAMSPDAVLESIGSTRTGLTEAEARRRRSGDPSHREPAEAGLARASMEELANPLTPALVAGAGASAASGSVVDPILITAVLALNGLIGGVQQVNARRALRALRRASTSPVRVRREEDEVAVAAGGLVPGDVVTLQAGDAVPADCRLLTGSGLEVDESSLTGESVPVPKAARATSARTIGERHSMLYEGTVVAGGRAEAVVVATGRRTEAGRALRLQEGGETPPSGVELRLRELTGHVLPFSLGAGVALVAIDLLRSLPVTTAMARAVGLAVAAVPEGLPFVATVAELAAAKRLTARGALVRNPSTIEALGRVDVLCFDKTGTLTEGRIALRAVSDGERTVRVDRPLPADLQDVLAAAVRASPFQMDAHEIPHQTDRAVLDGARRLGLQAGYAVEHVDELAFESNRGYHATLWRSPDDGMRLSVKGAPEVVLPLCTRRGSAPLDDAARARIAAQVERLARQGHRVLAVAERAGPDRTGLRESVVSELEFRGLLALVDPIRPTAAAAVATLLAAGVDVVMITGDHPSTAESIAAELDALGERRVLTGVELDDLPDDELDDVLRHTAVFARVTPAQKARVVQRLQEAGAAVAVTGDGTNDAPAIRLADVGIALGTRATPAAREAADVVVTDDRIETITDAIVEGRAMWSSVREALSILLGGNLGEIAYTLGAGLIGGRSLNARQLLLVNLLTDVLPAMAVAVRPPPDVTADQLLAEGPERSLGTSLTRDIQLRATTTATAAGAAWMLARPVSTPGQAATTGLVALVGAQLAQTMAVRGRTPLVAAAAVGSFVLLALAVQVPGLSHAVGSRPLLPHQWALALGAAAVATAAQLLGQSALRTRDADT